MAKAVVLCADDYGFNPEVSAAIRNLLLAGRLSATSVMTSMPHWPAAAAEITNLEQQTKYDFDLGLHLNFTDGSGLTKHFKAGFPTLKYWLVRSHLPLLDITVLKQEMAAQLERFSEHAGRLPDFIDGHQHVHQFPVFRRALLELVEQYDLGKKIWLRVTSPSCGDRSTHVKEKIISMTGAKKFAKLCERRSLNRNNNFGGITNFKMPYAYREQMRYWLQNCSDKTLLMCHPAENIASEDDVIARFRKIEYDYLLSNEFAEDCAASDISIKPGSQIFYNQ